MDNIINYLKDHLIMSIIIGSLLFITIYSMLAVFINKLYSAKYGKTTGLAWIPGINIYLLGKLVIHWIVGIIMFIGLVFGIIISFDIPYLESVKSILPQNYVLPYQIAYCVLILIICVIGKIKLQKILINNASKADEHAFINKDYDKEMEATTSEVNNNPPVNNTPQMINDNFQYNIPTENNDDSKNP
jgi:hypothetical protein